MEIKEKRWNGRKISQEFDIENEGRDFSAYYAAIQCLHDRFYKCGSMDSKNPIAFMRYMYTLPEKWHNMNSVDKKRAHGVMISSDWRNGSVKVLIFE